MSSMKRARSASNTPAREVDEVKRNKAGRPSRTSVGRKSLPAGFVSSTEAIDSSSEEEIDGNDSSSESERNLWKENKHSVSPERSLTPQRPVEDLEIDSADFPSPFIRTNVHTLSLRIQVPPGHASDIVLNLDVSALTNLNPSKLSSGITINGATLNPTNQAYNGTSSTSTSAIVATYGVGFLSLPPELRNVIYRMVLVRKEPVNLTRPGNWRRNAALLAACRQVHGEGTAILYGENQFKIERELRHRGAYYDEKWKEVGYKDCWRFLHTIGPINVSQIRNLHLTFEDGAGHLTTDDRLRFIHDDYLMQCLKAFAKSGRLRDLNLAFHGKRKVRPSDGRFLSHLFSIKADKVSFCTCRLRYQYTPYHGYGHRSNVQDGLEWIIIDHVERVRKLY